MIVDALREELKVGLQYTQPIMTQESFSRPTNSTTSMEPHLWGHALIPCENALTPSWCPIKMSNYQE